jgi:hypothetical protein
MKKRLKIDLYMPRPLADSPGVIEASKPETRMPSEITCCTVQRLAGGCVVYWLGRREPERTA